MTTLKAKQVSAIVLPDGGIGLVMVDNRGVIYTMHETGWMPVNMVVAESIQEETPS